MKTRPWYAPLLALLGIDRRSCVKCKYCSFRTRLSIIGSRYEGTWCNNTSVNGVVDYPDQLMEDRGGRFLNPYGGCRYWVGGG